MWFDEIKPNISKYNISQETIKKYDALLGSIIKLSSKRSSKNKYIEILDLLLKNYHDELILELIRAQPLIIGIDTIQNILENTNAYENDYLTEAIGCARNNFKRASIVLAWNAAAHRMRRVVKGMGFEIFNKDSEVLTKRKDRRYLSYNRKYNVLSENELNRIVLDNHLLLMLEYWGFFDSNQCDRLFTCYTMRCNSAHPGEAIITMPNLSSFYSDLKTMIFDNLHIRSLIEFDELLTS